MLKWPMVVQEIQQDLDAGNLDDIYVRDDELEGGPDIPLSELRARQQQQEIDEEAVNHPADKDDFAGMSGSSSSKDGMISSSPDATAAPEAEDLLAQGEPVSLGHDSLPEEGRSVSSGSERRKEQERPSNSADVDAIVMNSNGTASYGARTKPEAEKRGSPADKEDEAKKLAKQQELFGRSFSKPKRYAFCHLLGPGLANVELCSLPVLPS